MVVICVFVGIKELLGNKIRNMSDKNNCVKKFVERVETNWKWKTSQAMGKNTFVSYQFVVLL